MEVCNASLLGRRGEEKKAFSRTEIKMLQIFLCTRNGLSDMRKRFALNVLKQQQNERLNKQKQEQNFKKQKKAKHQRAQIATVVAAAGGANCSKKCILKKIKQLPHTYQLHVFVGSQL